MAKSPQVVQHATLKIRSGSTCHLMRRLFYTCIHFITIHIHVLSQILISFNLLPSISQCNSSQYRPTVVCPNFDYFDFSTCIYFQRFPRHDVAKLDTLFLCLIIKACDTTVFAPILLYYDREFMIHLKMRLLLDVERSSF